MCSLNFFNWSLLLQKKTNVSNVNEIENCSKYLDSQNYQLALQAGKNAVKLYPNSGYAHLCLGKAYYYLSYFNLSIKELEIAEKFINDKAALGAIYSFIGANYLGLGDLNNALLYYDRCLEIVRDLNDQEGESKTLNNIGVICSNIGVYDTALEYSNKSLQLTSDPSTIAAAYNNIAIVYSGKGDKNKAVEYYKKAIEFSQKAGDYHGTAINMIVLGATYVDLKNFPEAEYYLQKGLLTIQKLGDKYQEAGGYTGLGKLYLAQNQKSLAKEYFTKAYNLYKAIGNNKAAQNVLIYYGILLKEIGDNNDAQKSI